VDVAPHWGEPRISHVNVLGAMMFMLFMYFFIYSRCMIDPFDS
jgi:hypothetical protein